MVLAQHGIAADVRTEGRLIVPTLSRHAWVPATTGGFA